MPLPSSGRRSTRSTTREAYATARSAAAFLGKNLAAELAIQPTDLTAYGIDGTTPPDVAALGRVLIGTAKAFHLRLTSSVVVPGPRDDPHDAFVNLAASNAKVAALKRVLDAFMADLAGRTDPVTMKPLSEDIVITIEGDTPKTPFDRTNWLDDTPAKRVGSHGFTGTGSDGW